MRGFPTREEVEYIRKRYPPGTRLMLDEMPDDPRPVQSGTTGTVLGVDDAGQIMMRWDDERSLSLIPRVDHFHTICKPTDEKSVMQCTGKPEEPADAPDMSM